MPANNDLTHLGGRDFMRLYPIVSMQTANAGGARVIKGDPSQAVGRVGSGSRVIYANVQTLHNYMGMPLQSAVMSREATKLTLGGNAGVPIFHLPYNNDQNFRVTLVDRQNIGNVDFFITEFVDGCSVYVEGDQAGPTVYHINAVSTTRRRRWNKIYWSDAARRQADWDAKYAKMDQRFRTDGPVVKSVANAVPGTLPAATKLENHDYMGDLGLDLHALQMAQKAPTLINGQAVQGFELMAQQGTVFGERKAGMWKFYVQRRAFLRYLNVGANPVPTQLGFQWVVASVEQFWPTAKTGRAV